MLVWQREMFCVARVLTLFGALRGLPSVAVREVHPPAESDVEAEGRNLEQNFGHLCHSAVRPDSDFYLFSSEGTSLGSRVPNAQSFHIGDTPL